MFTNNYQVYFKDIIGHDQVIEELKLIVDCLKNPEKYEEKGISLPKGILFTGPPGIGKTHLAKAIANESGINLFYQSASEFEGMYVGGGAKKIRNFFESVRKQLPAIVFIDEIDALGVKRKDETSSFSRYLFTFRQLQVICFFYFDLCPYYKTILTKNI
jgi:cell division protease FtsH